MDNSSDLVPIIWAAATQAATSLKEATPYWHQRYDNEAADYDLTERNLTVHFGKALFDQLKKKAKDGEKPTLVFEASWFHPDSSKKDNHVDILCISSNGEWQIIVESKLLSGSIHAGAMINDIKKGKFNDFRVDLQNFEITYGKRPLPKHVQIVLASTWNENIRAYWDDEESFYPSGHRGAKWPILKNLLLNYIRKPFHVREDKRSKDRNLSNQYLLLAVKFNS